MVVLRTHLLVAFVSVVFFTPGCLLAEESAKQKKMDAVSREMAKERNQEIVFFGKIVDFEGAPVVDAKVRMSVRVFGARSPQSPFKDANAISDINGLFSVSGFGELISLKNISKSGYVYHYKYNRERSRWSVKNEQRKGPGFESDKPMVFKVRKKETPSFVFSGGWSFAMGNGQFKLLDLYRRQWANPDRLSGHKMSYPDWHADVKASIEEDGDQFRLILETLDPDSGFVIATPEFIEEMTEAPEHGYRSKLVLPFNKEEGRHLFAYVKSAGGLFYSKMYVSYSNSSGREYVALRFGYSTNMTGERGLERDDRIYSQYLRDEREGRRGRVLREQLINGETVAPFIEAAQ